MSDAQHTGSGFICPVCGMTNYSPRDVGAGYCNHCQDWTGDHLSYPRERVIP